MKKKTIFCAAALLSMSLVVPSYAVLFGDGLFNVRIIKIDPGGGSNDNDINNTTEAKNILAAVNAQLGPSATGNATVGGTVYNVTGNFSGTHDRIDFGGANRDYNNNQFNYDAFNGDNIDFLVAVNANISLAAGDWSMHMDGDDGGSVIIPGAAFNNRFGNSNGTPGADEILFEGPTGSSNTGAQMNLATDLNSTIDAIFFERGGGDYWEVSLGRGLFSGQNTTDFPFTLQQDMTGALFGAPVGISSVPFAVGGVPEPSSVVLMLSLFGGMIWVRRKRRAVA